MNWPAAIAASLLILVSVRMLASAARSRGFEVLDGAMEAFEPVAFAVRDESQSRLRRWLLLAGYRNPGAAPLFLMATLAALAVGALLAWLIHFSGLAMWMISQLRKFPGGVGEILAAVAAAAPWLILLLSSASPALFVRAARRHRVAQVERDLPLLLDLFSTLAEAGLSFDAALSRILAVQSMQRPLTVEFNMYRRELLAGVPRVQAMRRLARRLEVVSVTLFTSALAQAEQVGASTAETLRHQAEDMRDRRRMNALAKAQALPTKLVFPLIVCFLPGIFVTTLGPALFEMVKVVDSVLQFRR